METKLYDVIIIGSGLAGLTAAIYTSRGNLKTLVIAGSVHGGQLMLTTDVENYPGFPEGILGPELMERTRKQAERFGAEMLYDDITSVDFSNHPFRVRVGQKDYLGRSVIVATGASAKWLGLEGEQRLIGRGVSSCATCLPPSSLVVANTSTVPIQDVRPGLRVLTHDGSFKPVLKSTEREYVGQLVKFRTRFFRDGWTILTPNHPVLVTTLNKGKGANYWRFRWSDPMWLPARNLKPGHVVLYPIPSEEINQGFLDVSRELNLPVDEQGYVHLPHESPTAHRIPAKVGINKFFARLVGYYLSEGFSHSRGLSFVFSYTEKEYIRDCAKILKRIFKVEPRTKREASVVRVSAYSTILSQLFSKLFGNYSHEKAMPHYFVLLPRYLQEEIVKGVWRGDGSKRRKDFVITTSSRQLLEQLKLILLRLGVLPQTEKRRFEKLMRSNINGRNVEFKHDVYQLVVGGLWLAKMGAILGIRHSRLKNRKRIHHHAWLRDNHALLPVKQVGREPYKGMVYNLTVAENNTFVTPNSIVHNCDGPFFKGKDVVVVGGGNTAMEDSLHLAKLVKKVTVVHRRDKLRATKLLQERAFNTSNIHFVWNSVATGILGENKVDGVSIRNVQNGTESVINCSALFVAIGHEPNTKVFQGWLDLDERSYIRMPNNTSETNIKGVFAAGDAHDHRYRQAVTAAGFGCRAAMDAEAFLESLKDGAA